MTEKPTLARAALAAIFAHARETHPDECCGAVVATGGRDEVRRFTNVQGRLHQENPVDFPRDATAAYTPEPRELLEAIRAGEQPGARLAVFYHSHSKNGAYFSGEDQARAMFDGDPAYPEVTYLVVSDAREPDEARAFRWNETTHAFTEVEIAVTGVVGRKSAAAKSRRLAAKRPRTKARPRRKR
jgi:proteasome lid subunit RPN8/RPN11